RELTQKSTDIENKNHELTQKNIDLDLRYDQSRQLTEVMTNEIPEWLQDAIYTPRQVQESILDLIVELKAQQAAQSDDRHMRLRGEQGVHLRRGQLLIGERQYPEA